ncbi:MAG: hypothetical protein KDE28_25675 [Anaerolineales bacterium]|nr:hypothetical protein [Anaerolineales bacterium]
MSSVITHTDMELMRLRVAMSPGQRIQAMLAARELMVGIVRGRLRQQYPALSDSELNLKVIEELERVKTIRAWPQLIPANSR